MNNTATENFTSEITPAFQFGLPYIFAPLMIIAWIFGGWTILLVPIFGYVVITFFDALIGTVSYTHLTLPTIDPV